MNAEQRVVISERQRARLGRLAMEMKSDVVKFGISPTEAAARIIAKHALNVHEADRVIQKGNCLLNEYYVSTMPSKEANHPVADPTEAMEKAHKLASGKGAAMAKSAPPAGGQDMEEVPDYALDPRSVLPVEEGASVKVPVDEVAVKEKRVRGIRELLRKKNTEKANLEAELRNAKEKQESSLNARKSAVEWIKSQLKTAWLTGERDAFAKLYAAGLAVYGPAMEPKLAELLFGMLEGLEKEGVFSGPGDLLKFATVPAEFSARPRVVDCNRHIMLMLDTALGRGPGEHTGTITSDIFTRINIKAKEIRVLQDALRDAVDELNTYYVNGSAFGTPSAREMFRKPYLEPAKQMARRFPFEVI